METLSSKLTALASLCNDTERKMIEEMIISAADYVHAVTVMETKVTNYFGRSSNEKLEAVATSDSWRTGRHESLMTKVNIINRICTNHDMAPIYTGGSHRRQYGDFALRLVKEIFTGRI